MRTKLGPKILVVTFALAATTGCGDQGGSVGDAGSDAVVESGPPATFDGSVPSWRTSIVKWQWVELPGTTLADVAVKNPVNGETVHPNGRIDAWNGLAANRDDDRVYLACAGGHADWAGNEVYMIDFALEKPTWTMLRAPTTTIATDVPYYSDGRPSSTHLYYALQFVRAKNRIFKMSAGSVWGSGNSNNTFVDAFDLAKGDWDAKGTWTDSPAGNAINRPYAQDPVTDDVFTFGAGKFWRWTSSTGTWKSLGDKPSYANDDIVGGAPTVADPVRARAVFFVNAYKPGQGLAVAYAGGVTDLTVGGPAAAQVTKTQNGIQFVPSEDAFVLKTDKGGEVVRIDPTSYAATVLPTTGPTPPDAINGVYTRFLYLPYLKGIVYLPSHAANFWFLATE